MLCGLIGLKALGDSRGQAPALQALADTSSTRWYLAVSRWDVRLAAAEVLAALDVRTAASALVDARLQHALAEGDVNDVFSNALLLVTLGDARASAALAGLRTRFAADANAVAAVDALDKQLHALAPHR